MIIDTSFQKNCCHPTSRRTKTYLLPMPALPFKNQRKEEDPHSRVQCAQEQWQNQLRPLRQLLQEQELPAEPPVQVSEEAEQGNSTVSGFIIILFPSRVRARRETSMLLVILNLGRRLWVKQERTEQWQGTKVKEEMTTEQMQMMSSILEL